MKRFFAYILILFLALSFTGCSDGESGNGPVEVSLAVGSSSGTASRVVTVKETIDTSKLAYYYSASPLWTANEFASAQGATDGFQRILSFSNGMSLGLFAQGKWHFEVVVKLIDAEVAESNWTLVYSGSVDQYINADSSIVAVPVTKNTEANGAVTITVKAPTVDEDNDNLSITYDGTRSGSIPAGNIGVSRSDGFTTFTVSKTTLLSGEYTFMLTYNDGTGDVGGAVVSVNITPGMTAAISGSVESGLWQNETVALTGLHSFGIQLSAAGNKIEIRKNESLVYTCTKTPGSLDIDTYAWYVNGVLQNGQTASTFTLVASRFDCDYCLVTCVARADDDEGFLAYSSLNLILTE